MAELENQKVLQITDTNKTANGPAFITEDVVEIRRVKLIYYKWVSRLMLVLATGMILYGISATLAILKLVPNILIDAQIFVEFSDSQSLAKREYITAIIPRCSTPKECEKIQRSMIWRERVMVNFIKQYVELRNTFIKDEAEMKKRWLWGGLISYLSTYEVYKLFEQDFPKLTKEMVDKKASRSVEILSVGRSGGEKSYVWEVKFKTYDYFFDENGMGMNKNVEPIIEEKYWRANITCHTDPNRRTAYLRLLNPLGFVVIHYSQDESE